MTKKKKKKKKFKIVLLLIFLVLITLISLYVIKVRNSDTYQLKQKGYTELEITEIIKDKEFTDYVLDHDYNKLYLQLLNTKDYQFANIDKYQEYHIKYNDAPLEDIVYLVNNNIDKEYSSSLMEILKHQYFIMDRLDRYLAYLDKNNKTISEVITNVNSNIDYEFYTNTQKTDLSKEYLLIANKFYQLDANYKNNNLVTMESKYTRVGGALLEKTTYEAFKKLSDDARNEGYYIVNTSAYRSYDTQNAIYNNYKAEHGLVWADSYSARPGHSEHQTGLALDVGSASTTLSTFEYTKEFTWIKDNAHKYGFILRYPKGKEYITGYSYEPWHYRYVGVDAATFIYENNLTFEEYYAYYVENK